MASVVTGAFGYIGRFIAQYLLERGEQVKTITTHTSRPNPFGRPMDAFPYDFDRPDRLTANLSGTSTLYNNYWVRFEYGGATFRQAVQNTTILFECAKRAGVGKIVHISVTNPSPTSSLPYYAGKALQELALANSGVPYTIVRPTLVFGEGDILVNNIAWLIRRFPIFPIFGSGTYRVQPVFGRDLAAIAVGCATETIACIDAIGPEVYTFEEFVRLIARTIKPSTRFMHIPPSLGIALGKLIGLAVRDVILTRDELQGLSQNLLTSSQSPNGTTRFSEWLASNREKVGATYASELARHFR